MSDRVDALEGRMTENANGLEEAQQQIESVEKAVEKVENTVKVSTTWRSSRRMVCSKS